MPYYIQKPSRGRNWRIRGTHYGLRVDRSSGTPVRSEAEEVARAWERQAYETQVLGKRPPHPFHAAVIDYINAGGEELHLKPLVEYFRDRDVRHITQSDLDAASRAINRNVKSSTANRRTYTPFIAIMNLAALNGHCDYKRWRRPKQPEGRTDWRTPAEMDKVISFLRPNMRALVTFMLGTFPRAGETIDMLRRDISGNRAIFYETKGGYSRSVTIPPRAMMAVKHALNLPGDPDDHLWLTDNDPAPLHGSMTIYHALATASKKAGVKNVHPHVLRHTGATWRYAVTRDLPNVMISGGWKSLAMVQRYVHAGSDDLAEQVTQGQWCI